MFGGREIFWHANSSINNLFVKKVNMRHPRFYSYSAVMNIIIFFFIILISVALIWVWIFFFLWDRGGKKMSERITKRVCIIAIRYYRLAFAPPPPAIINNEFISPDDPRLPKLEDDIEGNAPVAEHLLFPPPSPQSGVPPAAVDCDGAGASSFLRICSSNRACMSICKIVFEHGLK